MQQQRVSIARMPLPPGLSRRLVIQHHHTAPLRVQGRQKHGLVRKLAPGVANADVRDFEDDGDGGPATAHNTCLVRPTRQVPLMHVHYRPCASACRCGTTAIGWSGVTVVSDVHPPSSARHAVWPAQPPKANPERCGRERRWPTCTHAWWPAGAGRNSVNITHRGTRRARTRPWPGPSQRRDEAPALAQIAQLGGRTGSPSPDHRARRGSGHRQTTTERRAPAVVAWKNGSTTEPGLHERTRLGLRSG